MIDMKHSNKRIISYIFLISIITFSGMSTVLADNNTTTKYIQCGDNIFPQPLAPIIHSIILLLQIVIPVGIIVMGSLDFLKAAIAGDAEKMKKNQKQFVVRLTAGIITFFIFAIVKFAVSTFADNATSSTSITNCLDCLINNSGGCDEVPNSPFDPDPDQIGG
jgi:ABC-type uncharacterized transport system permease subunit